jgi:hypothetical protein
VWADYFAEKTEVFDTKSTRDRYEKAGRYFKTYMDDVGRHHALAHSQQIENFLVALRNENVG